MIWFRADRNLPLTLGSISLFPSAIAFFLMGSLFSNASLSGSSVLCGRLLGLLHFSSGWKVS